MNPIFTFSDGSFTHVKNVSRSRALDSREGTFGFIEARLVYYDESFEGVDVVKHESLESANSELAELRAAVLAWQQRSKISPLAPMPDGSSVDLRHVARFSTSHDLLRVTYTNTLFDSIRCESVEDAEAERDGAIKLWAEYLESQP